MQDLTIRKASDLSQTAKEVIGAILGRSLHDDEEVGIWVSRPHGAPTGEARQKAWRELNHHLDLMASKAQNTPAGELEILVDEVSDEVRHDRP